MAAIQNVRGAAPANFNAVFATANFDPKSITVVNEDGTAANAVEVSFDGINVAMRLVPTINPGYVFNQSGRKVWIRLIAGAPNVQVTFEA